jgi:hypothetical protein
MPGSPLVPSLSFPVVGNAKALDVRAALEEGNGKVLHIGSDFDFSS